MKLRSITIQSVNSNNEVIEESSITVNPSSKIILSHDNNLTTKSIHMIHETFVKFLESDTQVVSLPQATKVSVIEIQ